MKFDVAVGNPPYQEKSVGDNNSDSSIYNHFYDLAEKIAIKITVDNCEYVWYTTYS